MPKASEYQSRGPYEGIDGIGQGGKVISVDGSKIDKPCPFREEGDEPGRQAALKDAEWFRELLKGTGLSLMGFSYRYQMSALDHVGRVHEFDQVQIGLLEDLARLRAIEEAARWRKECRDLWRNHRVPYCSMDGLREMKFNEMAAESELERLVEGGE